MGILIRPLVAFALFFIAAVIGRWILRQIPEGRIKQMLGRRFAVYPQNEAERRDWWPVVILFVVSAVLLGAILYADPLRH